MIEKVFMLVFLPYLKFFEWLRDHPRRFTPPAPAAQPGAVRRHDGSGRTWPVESSRLDPLTRLRCRHLAAGYACTHAAEPPSAADAIAAYGEQHGRHAKAEAPWHYRPAGWTPPTGRRAVRAALDDTRSWTARELHDMFAGAR